MGQGCIAGSATMRALKALVALEICVFLVALGGAQEQQEGAGLFSRTGTTPMSATSHPSPQVEKLSAAEDKLENAALQDEVQTYGQRKLQATKKASTSGGAIANEVQSLDASDTQAVGVAQKLVVVLDDLKGTPASSHEGVELGEGEGAGNPATTAAKATVKALEKKARHDHQNEVRDQKALKAAKLALSTLSPSAHSAASHSSSVTKKKKKKKVEAPKKAHKAHKAHKVHMKFFSGEKKAVQKKKKVHVKKAATKKHEKTTSGTTASLQLVQKSLPILQNAAKKETELQSSEKREAEKVEKASKNGKVTRVMETDIATHTRDKKMTQTMSHMVGIEKRVLNDWKHVDWAHANQKMLEAGLLGDRKGQLGESNANSPQQELAAAQKSMEQEMSRIENASNDVKKSKTATKKPKHSAKAKQPATVKQAVKKTVKKAMKKPVKAKKKKATGAKTRTRSTSAAKALKAKVKKQLVSKISNALTEMRSTASKIKMDEQNELKANKAAIAGTH